MLAHQQPSTRTRALSHLLRVHWRTNRQVQLLLDRNDVRIDPLLNDGTIGDHEGAHLRDIHRPPGWSTAEEPTPIRPVERN